MSLIGGMMREHRLVPWVVLFQLVCSVLCGGQLSAAWAQAQEETANEAPVYVDRAIIYYQDKKFDEALKELQRAIELDPQSTDALYYQGLVYAASNRAGEAQAVWEKVRGLNPADLDVAFQLGVLYFNGQEYDKAETLLRQVYGPEPTRPNIGYYLGFIEYRKKNYREALTFFKGNVPSDDDFAQLTRFYSSLAMSAMGFPREARAEIEEALKLQPVSPLTVPAQRFGEILQRAQERERFFHAEFRLGVFYDTNVPVTPNASSDLTATTSRQNQPTRKSEGQLATLNLAYTWLKTPDWEGNISHRFLQTYNDHLTNFDTQSNTPTIGITNRGTMPTAFGDFPYITGLQGTYDFITVGNHRFTERWIVNPFFTLVDNSWNLTTLQLRWQNKNFYHDHRFAKAEVRDADNIMLGPLHFFTFEDGAHYIKLGYQYDAEDAQGKNWTYRGNRLLMGFQYSLPWWEVKLRYDLDMDWRFHRFKHTQLPTEATDTRHRHDREPVNQISLSRDFSIPKESAPKNFWGLWTDFTVSLDYLFDKNKSNIAAFDYDRHVVTTSVTWHF